jgi:signal transduction histidine kinase
MRDGNSNRLTSINNQAFVYRKLDNPKKALQLYKSILEKNDLFKTDPSFYAQVIDNIAFTKFEAGETDYDVIERMLNQAYKISDSIQDRIRQLEIDIDLAKFYKGLDQIDKALPFAKEAYRLAKETSTNNLLLESMLILSELNPGEEGKNYLNEHIKLSDSLLFNERAARNKFARIAFETDEIERENERISRERLWLLGVSIGLVMTLVLLYIVITQRSKNKELRFRQSQQEANEEIYNLMLSQQDKVDEARANEKKRFSQELHDGILGRLFGTRLNLDTLNIIEGKDAMAKRSNYISDLKTIEDDIRKISHDLNTDFVAGSGFMDIIAELIEKQTQAYQLKFEFEHDGHINWDDISNKSKINIYRIIQESLQNIYKHAEANTVKISFRPKNNVICLSISDDGKGFDIHKSKKGIGLKNISSRVNELEGKVNFDSEINRGTTITINIPYQTN